MASCICVADEGSQYTPPTVYVATATAKSIGLQKLIDNWTSYSGMSAAFTHSSKLVTIHIDRVTADDSGQIQEQGWELTLPDVVFLLVQAEDSLATIAIPYAVAGGLLHRGDDASGDIALLRDGISSMIRPRPSSSRTRHS